MAHKASNPNVPPCRILVVERSVADCDAMRIRLGALVPGAEVADACGASICDAHFDSSQPPDFVVLNLDLEGGIGIGLLCRVKRDLRTSRILVFTSITDPSLEQVCVNLGADYFICSSRDSGGFEKALASLAELSRGRHQTVKKEVVPDGRRESPVEGNDSYLLIVEDSTVLLDILMQWFRAVFPKKPVLGVKSVAAAHEAIAAVKVDFFIVDYSLPDGTGLDFLSDVRTVWPEAQFILMTLEMPERERAEMMALNPVAYFRKPVDLGELEWVLRKHLFAAQSPGAPSANNGFKTMLRRASALDLIQLKCTDSATGALDFRNSKGSRGRVYFCKGEIIHAEADRRTGIQALSEILSWADGSALDAPTSELPPVSSIGTPWQVALMEASQLADETRPAAPEFRE